MAGLNNDLSLNFRKNYRDHIEEKILTEINLYLNEQDYQILVIGWIKSVNVCLVAVDIGDKLILAVGNTKDGVKIHQINLDLKRSCHLDEENFYKLFNISELKNTIPKNIFDILIKRGLICYGNKNATTTTLQRLIWTIGSNVNIKGLEIHHIDLKSLNNNITNLIPLENKFHKQLHADYRIGKITKEDYYSRIKEQKSLLKQPKNNNSRYNNDKTHFSICDYYHNCRLSRKKISRLNKKMPQIRAIQHILNSYPCFKDYYSTMEINSKKICTLSF